MSGQWNIARWRVDLDDGWLAPRLAWRRKRIRPDARLLSVLRVLIANAGETVSVEQLLQSAWPDRVVGRDSVTTAIYQLRQLLGDDSGVPRYIASEPRRGYRLIAHAVPVSRNSTRPRAAAVTGLLAVCAIGVAASWSRFNADAAIYVVPLQNYAESPVQGPLFSAIESTLLSELIATAPGRVRINDGEDVTLRLESMMVACDLGPTLVVRLLDTKKDAYIWSEAYNLEEAATMPGRPSLVEIVATDVGAAIR